MTKLMEPKHKYIDVRRWAAKMGLPYIHKRKTIYAPVHIDKCHWGMMVVSIRKKYIRCYDSLAYDCKKYIMAMAKYIEQEWKHE